MDFKLYYAPGACSFAPHMVLEELGMPYTTQKLDLAAGDQRKPEYLKLNPHGRVPTLVVDGKPLTENVAILTFLGGAFPDKGLWPKETWSQAMLLSALAWIGGTMHPAFAHFFRPIRYADDAAAQEAVKAKGFASFHDYLKQVDGWLAKSPKWMMGEQYTVGDPYLLVFYRWGVKSKLPMKELVHYTRHAERVMARPAVQRVMADEGITLG
ncbi:glutathione S-transferase family protein [Usitatibacter palustris]|uniref:Glutathione S-transferase n=1 Tax=Usitatibacter palustris TaxID=2732487 RepID=A0A6M4HBF8_9PROT|nr:glutathione S-transferase N-terminal domain-containing protein [Usitatibacter palustris]QJR16188.1 Glutathione S-transferase [Usitatibacter palustris]